VKALPADKLAAHNKAEAGRLRVREVRALERRNMLQEQTNDLLNAILTKMPVSGLR
jgi:hypothetical protein